jgi:hypothetical protein
MVLRLTSYILPIICSDQWCYGVHNRNTAATPAAAVPEYTDDSGVSNEPRLLTSLPPQQYWSRWCDMTASALCTTIEQLCTTDLPTMKQSLVVKAAETGISSHRKTAGACCFTVYA